MKILQVVLYFPPAWSYGGPVRVVYEFSRELVKRGHDVTVFTTDVMDKDNRVPLPIAELQNIEGITVWFFKNISNTLAHQQNIFITPKLYSQLASQLKQFDVVHLHEYYSIQSALTCHYCVKQHIPYVFHGHGTLPPERGGRSLRKRLFNKLLGNPILENAARVLAISRLEVSQYLEAGVSAEKIGMVPNGIHLDDFSALPSRDEFNQKYSINEQDKVILYLGQLIHWKAPDLVLEAFAQLEKSLGNIKLVLAGPDRGFKSVLVERIRQMQLANKIIFTGLLTGKDKLAAYKRADVFAFPSTNEGFGIVIIEAAACKIPVVISDTCGLAQDIATAEAGEVVRGNPAEISQALRKILSDPALAGKMGENGRRMVEEKFTWDKIVSALEEEYVKACNKNF